MVRTIVGVIVGYLVMAFLIFALFSAAYLTMGANAAFKAETYDVSSLWLIANFVLGLTAAVAGGYACAAIAKKRKAPLALAALVITLGLLFAIPVFKANSDGPSAPRSRDVTNMEAMQKARQPGWVALLNPLVGAVGVLLGARLRQGSRESRI
jgi:ABC-type transport system involved in multi-copper enzyme maturation permease subunit